MKTFSGTRAYQWTHHQCEKQLAYWYSGAPQRRPNLLLRLLFERGNALEARYIAAKRADASNVVDIREQRSRDRASATLDAMKAGAELILHPYFEDAEAFGLAALEIQLRGEGDVLQRVDGPRLESGFYPYRLIEVKSAATVAPHHVVQAGFYALLLGRVLGVPVEEATIITWRAEQGALTPHENPVNLVAMQDELRGLFTETLPVIVDDPVPDYHLRSSCSSCPYHEQCEEDAYKERHLSVLPGLRRRTRAELNDAGVHQWTQLAGSASDFEALENAWQGPTRIVLRTLRRQALALSLDACLPSGELDEEVAASPAWQLAAGSMTVPGARVYLDLETDAIEHRAYLFGYMLEASRVLPKSRIDALPEKARMLANIEANCTESGLLLDPVQRLGGPTEERELFESLLDALDAARDEFGQLSILHYGWFEVTQLRALARRYESIPDVDSRVERIVGECIDILAVLKATRVLPVTSYSLKEVAPTLARLTNGRYGRNWSGPRDRTELASFLSRSGMKVDEVTSGVRDVVAAAKRWGVPVQEILAPSAGNSVVWYRELLKENAPVWRLLINAYNGDDLHAARAVARWLFDEHRETTESARHPRAAVARAGGAR